jgi:hypothetical protein
MVFLLSCDLSHRFAIERILFIMWLSSDPTFCLTSVYFASRLFLLASPLIPSLRYWRRLASPLPFPSLPRGTKPLQYYTMPDMPAPHNSHCAILQRILVPLPRSAAPSSLFLPPQDWAWARASPLILPLSGLENINGLVLHHQCPIVRGRLLSSSPKLFNAHCSSRSSRPASSRHSYTSVVGVHLFLVIRAGWRSTSGTYAGFLFCW